MAIGHCGSPVGLRYESCDLDARLVRGARRSFEAIEIAPQRLRVDKIDAVLDLIRGRLRRIELEPY